MFYAMNAGTCDLINTFAAIKGESEQDVIEQFRGRIEELNRHVL